MVTRSRVLLIIEDDPVWNELCKVECEQVLQELPELKVEIHQATSYEQARRFLQERPADFISLDIALSKSEQGKSDRQRDEQEAGGIALLKELQGFRQQTFVVVVTGETLQSYAIDAYQAYGILAFYQKDRFDHDEYKHALKASLYYLEAADLIEQLEIEAATNSWQKALATAQEAGIKERNFENLSYKIKALREGLTHATTGLPMGRWTEDSLKSRIVGREGDWALVRVVIQGFSGFASAFPSQEKPILSFVAELLKQARREFEDEEMFIGHLGHREHLAEPVFVVIPGAESMERAGEIAAWLDNRFGQIGSGPFAPSPELLATEDRAKPSFDLELKVFPDDEDNYFSDLPFLIDTLGHISTPQH